MADAVIAVNPSTEPTAIDIDNSSIGSSSTLRQRIVIGGDTSSGSLINPGTTAPSSAVYGLPVRLAMNSTDNTIGSVAVSNTVNVSLLTSPISVQSNAGSPDSMPVTVFSSSASALYTFLSTGQNSSGIDPRVITAAGSSINFGVVPAGSSSYVFGQVFAGSTWPVSLLSAGSSINVGVVPAGSSSYALGQVWAGSTWPTAIISGGSSVSFSIVGTASSGVLGTVLLATALAGAAIDPRIIAAQATSVVLGAIAVQQSTSYWSGHRNYDDSTGNYNQKFFYSTSVIAPLASTVMVMNQVTNLTSGSSGSSFNVSTGRVLRIEYVSCSLRGTSGAALWADFAIRAEATSSGTTGTDTPIWMQRLVLAPPTTVAIGGGVTLAQQGLTLDLPSDASFGFTVASNSTVTNEVTFSFGGIEYIK